MASQDHTDAKARTADGPGPRTVPWRLVWLRKSVVFAFLVVFLACAAALVGLNQYASDQGGLYLRWRDNHYLWTYGSTAILAVILSLWRRVDNLYRLHQPWWNLLSGPMPASESVLPDCVSPFFLTTFFKALRNRHRPVSASVLVFILIKFAILVSTTLFFVGPSSKDATIPIQYRNAFSASDLWKNPVYLEDSLFVHETDYLTRFVGTGTSILAYLAELNSMCRPMIQKSLASSSLFTNATTFRLWIPT